MRTRELENSSSTSDHTSSLSPYSHEEVTAMKREEWLKDMREKAEALHDNFSPLG